MLSFMILNLSLSLSPLANASNIISCILFSYSEGLKEVAEHGSTRQLERELKEEVIYLSDIFCSLNHKKKL